MFLILSCICLCPIHWSQMLSREWRCTWSNADRWCSNYIWVINHFIAYWGATYIGGLTVFLAKGCRWRDGEMQISFCACTQPMRDGITLYHHLSLAGCILKMIPGMAGQHWSRPGIHDIGHVFLPVRIDHFTHPPLVTKHWNRNVILRKFSSSTSPTAVI